MRRTRHWLLASAATLGALLATTAVAQTNPPKKPTEAAAAGDQEGTEVESVVVTGSFLRGTPETATIPVEGYNLEQLRNQGSPSNLDFVKNLSEIGQVYGESNRSNLVGVGQQTINLRALGASRTVVVFNGRRMNEEYSFGLGRSNNIATIPNCAIGRVEILKDGGGTTYGADAIGGVVNYITRRNFNGVEVQANYRYIDGSDGDWGTCVTAGKTFDKGNVQASVSFNHRSILPVTERDWAFRPYLENTSGWGATNNPGAYQLVQQAITGTSAAPVMTNNALTPGGAGILQYNNLNAALKPNDLQFGSSGGFRDPNCTTLGGFAGWQAFGTGAQPVCYMPNGYFQNLVEESNTGQAFLEGNWEFSSRFKVHGELSFYWLDIPNVPLDLFTASVGAVPMARDKFGVVSATGAAQTVSTVNSFLVPSYNPGVQALLPTLKNSDGTNILSPAQLAAWGDMTWATNQYVGLSSLYWKPFGVGGGAFGGGAVDEQSNTSKQYSATLEFSGDLGKIAFGAWDWELTMSHGWGNYLINAPDILIDRLQNALNGYGGASCPGAPGTAANPVTVVAGKPTPAIAPGTGGCQFFNPFPSAYAGNVATGQANPSYKASLQNDQALVDWMYTPIRTHFPGQFDTVDLIFHGDLDYHLWTDKPIRVAFGAQYRERHSQVLAPILGDQNVNPCATVGATVCTSRLGPTVFRRHVNTSGVTQSYDRRYPVEAAFAEVEVPITEKLNTNVSTRWEKYISDVSDVDNEVVVAAGGIRYQMTDKVAFRATGGQTFSQANPLAAVPDILATVASGPATFGSVAGLNYQTRNVPNPDVRPERGFNYNIGGIFQIGSAVTATVDYYSIEIGSVIDPGGLTATTVINAAVQPGSTGQAALLNCESPVVTQAQSSLAGRSFFQLPTGYACVQGTTTVNDALAGIQTQDPGRVKLGTTQVSFFGAQGQERRTYNGGSLDTSGIDLNVRWRVPQPIWDGDLTATADLTYILTYNIGAYQFAGIPYSVPYDGLGYTNTGAARPGGQRVAPWRGSLTFNFHKGRHNFNWITRAVASVSNTDVSLLTGSSFPSASLNANIGDVNGSYVSAACSQVGLIAPPVPTAAGTGIYGARGVLGATPGNQILIGYNGCTNTALTNGNKLAAQFNSAFTWRVQLPNDLDFTLSIDNVFNTDPAFTRDGLSYDASSTAGPLGRTYQVSLRKTF